MLYDVLHYMETWERKRIYEEIYMILKEDGLLSVYSKHHKSNGPLGNLSNMELEDVIIGDKQSVFLFAGEIL